MVDILALAVSHGLLAIAAWRLLSRPELDDETGRARTGPSEQPKAEKRGPVRRAMRWPNGGNGDD